MHHIDEGPIIRAILEGTASSTGEQFYAALAKTFMLVYFYGYLPFPICLLWLRVGIVDENKEAASTKMKKQLLSISPPPGILG